MKRPAVSSLTLAALIAWAPLAAEDAAVRERIAARLPGADAADVRASPVPGLYEVILGPRVLYVSEDGRYVLSGALIDLDTQANVTEPRRADARAAWVGALDEARMVIFEPEGDARHTVTVFTDVDCNYCRAMHREIDELLERRVRVRYLLYPRDGPGTESARRAAHVWCSPDRRSALTRAKRGERVSAPPCDTPIADNLALGRELPVSGTPTLVTETGDVIPGYIPAAQLVGELDRLRAERVSPARPAAEPR